MKIVGNPQNTGTEGHAREMTKLAIEHAKDPDVSFVFMNQGIKKATGVDISPNIRPDVMTVVKDGKFHLYEVRSKTDTTNALQKRMQGGLEAIPEAMRGAEKVIEIPGIIYKGDK